MSETAEIMHVARVSVGFADRAMPRPPEARSAQGLRGTGAAVCAILTPAHSTAEQSRKRPVATSSSANQFERAYSGLRRLLRLQAVPEGYWLRELEWTERLKVNRAALRQAMARLEAEGMLIKLPRSGFAVPKLTPADLVEAREARFLLEAGAIERICRAGKPAPAVLKPLETMCLRFEKLLSAGPGEAVLEADRSFHDALVAAAGNRKLTLIHRRASMPLFPWRVVGEASWRAQWPRILQQHRQILRALLDGNASRATSVLREHVIPNEPDAAVGKSGRVGH